jgi:hypothetical protein
MVMKAKVDTSLWKESDGEEYPSESPMNRTNPIRDGATETMYLTFPPFSL